MEKLLKLLEDLRPDVDFNEEKKLIDNSVLDSFDIVTLVGELNEEFEIDISVDDLVPENFNSVENMMLLIKNLQED